MAKMFGLRIDYNNIAESFISRFKEEDLDYIRSKIMTDRSLKGNEVLMKDSYFYEGAKTLVDLLEYVLKSIVIGMGPYDSAIVVDNVETIKIRTIELSIDNFADEIPYSSVKAEFQLTFTDKTKDILTFIGIYSNLGKPFHHGAFLNMFVYHGVCMSYGDSTMEGDIPDVNGMHIPKTARIFKCGKAMKYCLNFPPPTIYMDGIVSTIRQLLQLNPNRGYQADRQMIESLGLGGED